MAPRASTRLVLLRVLHKQGLAALFRMASPADVWSI
jgi:hypothetical protein